LGLIQLDLTDRLDEETITGALLGALNAEISWFEHASFGTNLAQCSWMSYTKRDKSSMAEPISGADFALALRFPGGLSRVAVFQAKRVTTNASHTSIDRRSKKHPEQQFYRLAQFRYQGSTSAKTIDISSTVLAD